MFSRKNIGSEPQKCEKCGSDKVFFVQHSHGNYPILDYVCPKCDLGGDQGVPEGYMNPTGKDDAPEDLASQVPSMTEVVIRAFPVTGYGPGPCPKCSKEVRGLVMFG